MAPARSRSSSNGSCPPPLTDSSSGAGDHLPPDPASSDTDGTDASGSSGDSGWPGDGYPADHPTSNGTPSGTGTADDATTSSEQHLRARSQLADLEAVARNLGRQHAAAELAVARSLGAALGRSTPPLRSPSRPGPAARAALRVRGAALRIAHWCVFRAVARDLYFGDPELQHVRRRLGAMARNWARIGDIEQIELLEVALVNRLHARARETVDDLLCPRRTRRAM